MQLLDILKNIGAEGQQALGKIPREAMVGVGLGLASGQPGAPLQGFAAGMGARQQAQLDQEDRALARQKFDLQRQEIEARLESLKLDRDQQKALQLGRERLSAVLRQNPNISPTDAFRLAALETGDENWLQRWGDAETKTAQAQQLQEYRDAMLGISATNAATNASNAATNAARIAQEQQAKQAEKARGLQQQAIDLDTSFEQQQRALDSQLQLGGQLLQSPGFDRNFGLLGAVPNVPGWAGADADALINRFGSGEIMNLVREGAMKGVLSDSDIKIMERASSVLSDRKQSPEQARAALTEALGVMRKLKDAAQGTYERKRSTLGAQPGPAGTPTPSGAGAGKTTTRAQLERIAQRRGVSVEQAMQDAQAAGFRVLGQ